MGLSTSCSGSELKVRSFSHGFECRQSRVSWRYSKPCAATPKIKDGVGGFSLRKEVLFFVWFDDSAPYPSARQKVGICIECRLRIFKHLQLLLENVHAAWRMQGS
jgi:hypothetical protein